MCGNPVMTGRVPSQGASDSELGCFLVLAWTTFWTNGWGFGDFRCDNAHIMSLWYKIMHVYLPDTVPEGYWKALAEERRAALADSLEENCELHGRIQEQLQEIERLTELANQAEYFASLLRVSD